MEEVHRQGTGYLDSDSIVLTEGDSFDVLAEYTLQYPQNPGTLTFRYQDLNFYLSATGNEIQLRLRGPRLSTATATALFLRSRPTAMRFSTLRDGQAPVLVPLPEMFADLRD